MSAAARPRSLATHVVLALRRYGTALDEVGPARTALASLLSAPVSDLVVLDGADLPDAGPRLRNAILAARRPGLHDPTADAAVYRLDAETCRRLVGAPGTTRLAEPDLLAALAPHGLAPDRPSADARARIALDLQADHAFAEAMIALRRRLTAAAVHRQTSLGQCNAYWKRVGPILAEAAEAVARAWHRVGDPDRDIARPGNVFALFDPDAEHPVTHLAAGAPADHARLARLVAALDGETSATIVLVPAGGALADTAALGALDGTVESARRAMLDGHSAYRAARERHDALDAWISQTLDGIVTLAETQLGPTRRPIEQAMHALRLEFVNETGGCTILGPNVPIGDQEGFALLMAEARPAEAVRALFQPRQWPNLFDLLDAHPLLQRVAARLHARPGPADLEISGSTDIRAIRRPGLSGETRFEALRLGEQRSLTVPLAPGQESLYARLRPGQTLRVNAHKADAIDDTGDPDEAVSAQVDLMVTGFPQRLNLERLTPRQIERLAHREGLTANAYTALLARQRGGLVIPVKPVAERSIRAEQHRALRRERAQQRQIVKAIVRERANEQGPGLERGGRGIGR